MPAKSLIEKIDPAKWGITPDKLKEFKHSPASFRASLIIGSAATAKRFKPDPWQEESLLALDELWKMVVGLKDPSFPKFAWIGRARGHSKTMDEAMQLIWAVAFCQRRIKGTVGAGTKDQAGLMRESVLTLLMLNPWLGKTGLDLIRVQHNRVLNPKTRSQAKIISSDACSAFGDTPDFILCDEVTHWKSKALWEPLSTSAGKKPNCALIIMTNAGKERTWQAELRDEAKTKPAEWIYRDMHGPQASWITPATLEAQKGLLGGDMKAFRRLWMNEWQLETGDALDYADIRACLRHDRGMSGDEHSSGWVFIGGVDLSVKKHRSALVVLGVHPIEHRIRLAACQSWLPDSETGLVDLQKIQSQIEDHHRRFNFVKVLFDPYQAALMKQQLDERGIWMEEMKFQGEGATRMAMTILDVFKSRRIELFDHKELVDDLTKLNIVSRGFGYKIEAETDQFGHADTAFALSICLPAAVEMAGMPRMNVFVDRPVVQSLDELELKLHNLDKEAQKSILGEIDAALAGASDVPSLSRQRIEDHRPDLVKVLEENAIQLVPQEDEAA